MKELKHASARGVVWNLVQNVVSRLLALIVVAILSRLLDKSAFGSLALALAITQFVELFVNGGYGEFVTQTRKLEDEHLDTAFWFNVGVGVVLTAAIAIAATPIAVAFDEPEVAPVIRWLSLSLLVRSLSIVPAGLLVRELRFRELSLRTVVAAAIGGIAGIVAAFSGAGVYSLVIQMLVGDVVATAVLWRATSWRPGRRTSATSLRDLSAFGTPIIGATLIGFVSRRMDSLFVGGALGVATLGVYSMAQRVYQIALQVINKSTTDVAFSALSRLADSEDERRQAFTRVVETTSVVCFPTYVGLALVAEPLTLTLFGTKWVDSADALAMFALSGVPFSLFLMHLSAFKSAARTRLLVWSNIWQLVVFVPSMLLLVEHGPAHAAAATLITSAAAIPLDIVFLRAALGVRPLQYMRALVGASLATVAMAAATYPLAAAVTELHPIARLAIVGAAGAVTYIIALRVLAPSTFQRTFALLRSVVRKRRPA